MRKRKSDKMRERKGDRDREDTARKGRWTGAEEC